MASITIYTTPTCRFCSMAKNYLGKKGFQYTEYDVSDRKRALEAHNISGKDSVPVLVINGRVVVGFDPQLIDDALSRPPPPKRDTAIQNIIFDPFES